MIPTMILLTEKNGKTSFLNANYIKEIVYSEIKQCSSISLVDKVNGINLSFYDVKESPDAIFDMIINTKAYIEAKIEFEKELNLSGMRNFTTKRG